MSKRSTPLTHSFCQHVVASAKPLVIADARDHDLVRDNLALPDLGVLAYAGIPLTDEAGNVLGMMPHPERAIERAHGGSDGRALFESAVKGLVGA